MNFSNFKKIIRLFFEPNGKVAFLKNIRNGSSVLDVGCGNNSVSLFKSINSSINYTGIDVADYNLNVIDKGLMDRYIITTPLEFSSAILNAGEFDYIVCSHNLEHCNDWRSVVKAMCSVIKVGGEIYIATPSIKTLSFPSRNGTLNFKDDSTHNEIVDFNELEIIIKSNGLEIKYMSISDKPFFMYLVGLINELPSKIKNQVLRGTWAYWGFEAKMWARKFK
jgi:2-polyprenyl-3-methyl-5-hydroxy-6-metoxy-1,4-benzoquinol methylase